MFDVSIQAATSPAGSISSSERQGLTLAEELAIAMAEEGFVVPTAQDQWDAPWAEAARIVAKLDLEAEGMRPAR